MSASQPQKESPASPSRAPTSASTQANSNAMPQPKEGPVRPATTFRPVVPRSNLEMASPITKPLDAKPRVTTKEPGRGRPKRVDTADDTDTIPSQVQSGALNIVQPPMQAGSALLVPPNSNVNAGTANVSANQVQSGPFNAAQRSGQSSPASLGPIGIRIMAPDYLMLYENILIHTIITLTPSPPRGVLTSVYENHFSTAVFGNNLPPYFFQLANSVLRLREDGYWTRKTPGIQSTFSNPPISSHTAQHMVLHILLGTIWRIAPPYPAIVSADFLLDYFGIALQTLSVEAQALMNIAYGCLIPIGNRYWQRDPNFPFRILSYRRSSNILDLLRH